MAMHGQRYMTKDFRMTDRAEFLRRQGEETQVGCRPASFLDAVCVKFCQKDAF